LPTFSKRLESSYHFLSSKQLALVLFLLLCVSLIPGTLAESGFHASRVSRVIIACMVVNLVLCTARRIRTLPLPVLIMHVGTIITLSGGMISSLGFIATVQIYEGMGTENVFRWDLEQDVPLGATLSVKKINEEFYPVPVRIGVLKGTEKVGLFELKTGGSFSLEGYTVKAEALDPGAENLKLSVFQRGRLIGSLDTEGTERDVPSGFPYDFKLVAYKTPALRRVAVDLLFSRGAEIVAEGTTEINAPFTWNGLFFHMTNLERDEYGAPYAGLQIVKDPGKPFVFLGFTVITIGSLFWLYKKLYGRRRLLSLKTRRSQAVEP